MGRTLLIALSLMLWSCHRPALPPEPTVPDPGRYLVRTLVFYNVENLFDTVNDTLTADDDRTPEGRDRWTAERYEKKLADISRVLSEVGRSETGRIPDLIGLCEIENLGVLQDLLTQSALKDGGYGIVHYDSPDARGIDVALIYKKDVFIPLDSQSRRLLLFDWDGTRKYTRDQLVVEGLLDNETIYIAVNHWPSRSGGQQRSAEFRREAAKLQRRILDSLIGANPESRFVSMGDYNDEPTDRSIVFDLGATDTVSENNPYQLYNPMNELFDAGIGSLAYRDRWSLFDQIMFSGNWFVDSSGYQLWKAGVFRPDYLRTSGGNYAGYPYRTYAGGQYQGGFSDHFPVYAFLIKKLE